MWNVPTSVKLFIFLFLKNSHIYEAIAKRITFLALNISSYFIKLTVTGRLRSVWFAGIVHLFNMISTNLCISLNGCLKCSFLNFPHIIEVNTDSFNKNMYVRFFNGSRKTFFVESAFLFLRTHGPLVVKWKLDLQIILLFIFDNYVISLWLFKQY